MDGDLEELDAETLKKMRGEIKRVDAPVNMIYSRFTRGGMQPLAAAGASKKHRQRQEAQSRLREAIAWWAGYQRAEGRTDSQSYRLFYFKFGIDVMSAQALGRPAAEALMERVNNDRR